MFKEIACILISIILLIEILFFFKDVSHTHKNKYNFEYVNKLIQQLTFMISFLTHGYK